MGRVAANTAGEGQAVAGARAGTRMWLGRATYTKCHGHPPRINPYWPPSVRARCSRGFGSTDLNQR